MHGFVLFIANNQPLLPRNLLLLNSLPMVSFTKHNSSGHPEALICEAHGLQQLAKAVEKRSLRVPEVISVDTDHIEMTQVEIHGWTAEAMARLGHELAHLHLAPVADDAIGLDRDNFIGLNPQCNAPSPNGADWGSFFLDQRLGFQIARIQDTKIRKAFEERLAAKREPLREFLNASFERPSLVHGDLWGGNVLHDGTNVWLIDPAVYHGDREVDVAMTELFGGFRPAFYSAYDTVWPRTANYPRKRELYNLYHLLNHYNLFGSGYLGGCERGFAVIESL